MLPYRITRKLTKLAHGIHQAAGALEVALSENDRRLQALQNTHPGQTAFVIGNGPSLNTDDLERLRPHATFASNKISLAYENTDWRPTYFSVIDVLVAENNRERLLAIDTPRIHSSDVVRWLGQDREAIWVHSRYYNQNHLEGDFRFSRNPLAGVHAGWSVLYFQLQLAYYMGFTRVFLIGTDFSFTTSPSTGQRSAHGEVLASLGEVNHFHRNYRQPGETWTVPRLDLQRKAFLAARHAFEADGRTLANASRRSELDVLPRVDLDETLAELST